MVDFWGKMVYDCVVLVNIATGIETEGTVVLDKVVCITSSMGSETRVYFVGGNSLVVRKPFDEFKKILNENL